MLGSVGVLVVSVVVLAGIHLGRARDYYSVRFTSSVHGLESGSQVRYQGLHVGRVELMRVCPQNPMEIEVKISLKPDTVIYEGTEAVLSLSGLTGAKTINLVVTHGDIGPEVIPPGSVLPTGSSLMDKLEGDAEVIAAKVARVADQLASWTDETNRLRVERLIDNTSSLMLSVRLLVEDSRPPLMTFIEQSNQTLVAVEKIVSTSEELLLENRDSFRRSLLMLAKTLAHLRNILKSVEPEDVQQAVFAAKNAMDAVHQRFSDAELGHLIEDLREGLNSVVVMVGELELAVRASREDFVLTLKHVREASEDIREFSRIIAQDPSILVRGAELTE